MNINKEDIGKIFKTREGKEVTLVEIDIKCLRYPFKFSDNRWRTEDGSYFHGIYSDEHPKDIVEKLDETYRDRVLLELGQKMLPKKYNDGKPLMNLVRPEFIKAMASGLTYGFNKYDENKADVPNYLKGEGFHYSDIYDSLQRHLNAFWSGENIDPESGIEHLALAAVNIMFLHTYEHSEKGIDNRTILKVDE